MARRLIDLSRPISHMMPVANPHVNQVPAFWYRLTHETEKGTHKHSDISFKIRDFLIGEHVGTHVDALCHFTPDPDAPDTSTMGLEWFITDAICVDLSHKAPKSFIEKDELIAAVEETGLAIKPDSTFLYFQDYYSRQGEPNWLHEFAGLTGEATHWLAAQGVKNIGCETASIDNSEAMPKDANPSFPAHRACRDRGIINTENLANLDKVVGQAFTYIGLPLPLVGGTGSPIRAVALLDA